jgi:protein SCO1/2
MMYRGAVSAIAVVLFWAAAGAEVPAIHADAAPAPSHSHLLDQFARSVDARRLANRWLLVYFGYARCADICPAALTRMTRTLDRLGRAGAAVQPVFVTLDPEHDSPAVLRAFAAHFTPRLIALTGSKEAIDAATHRFSVQWHPNAGEMGIDHGALVYLAAPDGRIVQIFYPQEPVAEMAAAIRARVAAAAARDHLG